MESLLANWHPGFGEVETIRRMQPGVRQFLADAFAVDPAFLEEYILPVLSELDPETLIVSDLSRAISEVELEDALSGETENLGELGFLGKSLKKKLKKVVSKVKEVHKKVEEKIVPKAIQKIPEKIKEAVKEVGQKVQATAKRVGERVQTGAKKTWIKYGNTIITVAGAVLAPFTGGASLAAAAALTAANTMYQTKRAAQAAKLGAKHEAAQLETQAKQQESAVSGQVDDFFNQNQAWFAQYDMTPSKWSGLTLDQKVEFINAGAEGRLPRTPPVEQPVSAPPPSGGMTPSGGGGGGGGGGTYPEGTFPSGGFQPPGEGRPTTGVQQAGMFGGSMAPLLIAGAIAALVFGKPSKGRRTRRNPALRRRRRMLACA